MCCASTSTSCASASTARPRTRNRHHRCEVPAMNAAPIPAPPIEFWFEFGSNYSYLSAMRIESAAAARGVRVLWKPFLLGPIFKQLGWDTSPFVLQKEKGAYAFKDMERQCRKY